MSLEKKTTVDRIEVIVSGLVLVHTKTAIVENGVEISASMDRTNIAPGNDYSGQSAHVQAICAATHTAEVVAAYQAAQAAQAMPAPQE
jgi:hypothetical protein